MNGTGDSEHDPLDGLTLDEEFVRGAAHKEASARARMLAARWRHTPPVDPGGRRWSGPQDPPAKRRRRPVPRLVAIVLTVALVVGGLTLSGLFGRGKGGGSGNGPGSGGAGDLPTPATTASPFAGSPAASWASNGDGIVLPAARQVGTLPAATVGQDLSRVKLYLIVAYLNPQLLGGGSPQPVLDLLTSRQRSFLSQSLAHPSHDSDPVLWLSRFNPSYARMAGSAVRVRGTVTDASDGQGGLLVRTDFSFVYAAVKAPNGTAVARLLARRVLQFHFYDPTRFQVEADRLYVEPVGGYSDNDRCDLTDGYLNPAFPNGPGFAPPGAGPAANPYASAQPLPSPDTTACTPVQAP